MILAVLNSCPFRATTVITRPGRPEHPLQTSSASWCVTVKQHYSDCSVLYAHADHMCMAGDEVPNLANHLLLYYIPRI
jgi:hypothetical protein